MNRLVGSRDAGRFRGVFARQYRAVLAYALRRASEADAHDVVADTFLVAWRRLRDVPAGDAELPWLLGVARRTLANQRRAKLRAARLADRLAEEPRAPADNEHGLLEALSRRPARS